MDNNLGTYNYTTNFTKKNYTLGIGAKKLADMCSKNSSLDACKQIKKQTLLNKVPRQSMLLDVLLLTPFFGTSQRISEGKEYQIEKWQYAWKDRS